MIIPEPLVDEKKKKKVVASQVQEPDPVIPQPIIPPPVEKTIKQRQGNYVEDFNDLPEGFQSNIPVEPAPAKRDSRTIVSDIMGTTFPKPQYNVDREAEYRRLAKAASFSKGVNLLGDVVSLGVGANVNRRQADGKEQGYIKDMFDFQLGASSTFFEATGFLVAFISILLTTIPNLVPIIGAIGLILIYALGVRSIFIYDTSSIINREVNYIISLLD